ncbi:MAG: RNA-binding protein [Nanoarchaeota archaeon]|nr:RNA-binding protein [Nanoarchaeota archaeon]
MGTKIYVGNLPFTVTEKDLTELFSPYGELVEVTLIMNKFSGRSKGFGFVTFADEAVATKAMAEMNGKDVQGRPVTVTEAKPLDPNRPPRRDFDNRRRF